MRTVSSTSRNPLSLAMSVCLAAVSLAGCAEALPDDDAPAEEQGEHVEALPLLALGATGTGCRSGTWSTTGYNSDLGLDFHFKSFGTSASAGEVKSVECVMTLPSSGLPSHMQSGKRLAIGKFTVTSKRPPQNRGSTKVRGWGGVSGKSYVTPVTSPAIPAGEGKHSYKFELPDNRRVWRECGDNSDLTVRVSLDVTGGEGALQTGNVLDVGDWFIWYTDCK